MVVCLFVVCCLLYVINVNNPGGDPGGDERPSNPSSKEVVQGGGHASPSNPSSKEGCGRFAVPLVPGEEYIIIPRDEYDRLKTGGGINVVA